MEWDKDLPNAQTLACGRVFQAWFQRNGWSQNVVQMWQKMSGSPGPHNSQISKIYNGVLEPKPPFFIYIAEFNKYVADQDFSNLQNMQLKRFLKGAEPLCDEKGKPYDAIDFFSLYVGGIKLPDWAVKPKALSDDEAQKLSEKVMDLFKKHAQSQMLDPLSAWENLKPFLQDLDEIQVEKFRKVLSGWGETWSGEEATLLNEHGDFMPIRLLKDWIEKKNS